MKHPLWTLALAAGLAGPVQAQPGSVWGALDAGLVERSAASLAIGKRDANILGFKGVDELGSGLKALFQPDIGYEMDGAAPESGLRARLPGVSRAGLRSAAASLRISRAGAAYLDMLGAFDPFHIASAPPGSADQAAVAANQR